MTDTAADLMFDLTLTDEQRMNRESMQRFAAAEMRTLSKAVDAGTSPARDFYPKTAELGLTLLPIPEHPRVRHLGFLDDRDKFDLIAGATAVQIGTANFIDPRTALDVITGIEHYLRLHGIRDIADLVGTLET